MRLQTSPLAVGRSTFQENATLLKTKLENDFKIDLVLIVFANFCFCIVKRGKTQVFLFFVLLNYYLQSEDGQ